MDIKNSWLIVHEWNGLTPLKKMVFDKSPIWVQLRGLQINGKTPQMEMKLGVRIGESCKVGVFDMPDRTTIVKVKVKMRISEHISLDMHIGSKASGITWIDFMYEKLSPFCFKYGIIGHNEEFCKNPTSPKHGIT